MSELKKQESFEEGKKIIHTYPLVRHSEMADEMTKDSMDVVVGACEKHPDNYENAAKSIKEAMDKKYGATWHCAVGETFGFDVSFEAKHLIYMFYAGNLGIAVWKCC